MIWKYNQKELHYLQQNSEILRFWWNISNILGIIVEAITKGEMSGALKIYMKNIHEKYTWKIYMKNIHAKYTCKIYMKNIHEKIYKFSTQ